MLCERLGSGFAELSERERFWRSRFGNLALSRRAYPPPGTCHARNQRHRSTVDRKLRIGCAFLWILKCRLILAGNIDVKRICVHNSAVCGKVLISQWKVTRSIPIHIALCARGKALRRRRR